MMGVVIIAGWCGYEISGDKETYYNEEENNEENKWNVEKMNLYDKRLAKK